MRTLSSTGLLILSLGGALAAQTVTRSFGNVVFPGGTGRGIQRGFGNVVLPGSAGARVTAPFSITDPTFGARLGANIGGQNVLRQSAGSRGGGGNFRRGTTVLPYAVPIYVGGGYGMGSGDGSYDYAPPQQQPPPNIIVVYPPQQPQQMMQPLPDTVSVYQAPVTSGNNPNGQSMNEQPSGYLIAFKDHTVYAAVAYWVDGDTLHYFTDSSTHNQVSLSLVDRALTERLNRERGADLRLPK